MPSTEVDHVRLHYELDGHGPPLFVLHGGLGFDHLVYRRTLSPLANGRRLIFFDHRGNGRSGTVDLGTVTMERLADDVAGLADALGANRFSVLGHSYGGFVAQELALRHVDRLDALILVATTPGQLGTDESPGDEQGPPPPPELVELMHHAPANDGEMAAMAPQLLPFYFHAATANEVLPLFDETVFRADVMMRGYEVLAGWSSIDRLGDIDVPTLVIAGRHDVITSYPQSHRIASRIPSSELVILEHSGHFPWIEEPERFFTTVTGWLDRTAPTS